MKHLPVLELKLTNKQLKKIKDVYWNQLLADWEKGENGYIIVEPMVETGVLRICYLPLARGKDILKSVHKKDIVEINEQIKESA
ncbi:MAG: hypothetical protein WC107_05830 [Patescibacteria group bacterium]|jgi:hypothetical protein